ncbi:hypothetical protein Tco_0857523 [Tanacetum coccineum]|uniref:Uncharacterized protein n=1 Tax=Tanacetum coccineum TaxID=301880 RepID=A0ABQ5B7C1_9ASTR
MGMERVPRSTKYQQLGRNVTPDPLKPSLHMGRNVTLDPDTTANSYTGENIPLFLAMIVQGSVVQGDGSTHPVESYHTPNSAPSTSQPPVSPTSRRTTRQEYVVPRPRSPTQTPIVDKAASICVDYDTTRIDGFLYNIIKERESLEIDLKQTKKIYGAAYTRLIKKGRKIAAIDQDTGISLVQHDVEIQGRYGHDMEFDFDFDAAKEVSTAEKDVITAKPVSTACAAVTNASVVVSTVSPIRNTGVSTANDITMAETMVYIRKSEVKDKDARLQAELKEEKRKRIVRVHEASSSFNVEE